MRKLFKSMFETNSADSAPETQAKAEEDFFANEPVSYGKQSSGMEVVELSFDDYIRVMKSQERMILR